MFDSREFKAPDLNEGEERAKNLEEKILENPEKEKEIDLSGPIERIKARDEEENQARKNELEALYAREAEEERFRQREVDEAYTRAAREKRNLMN